MLKKLSIAFLAALLFAVVFAVTAYAAPEDFSAVLDKANAAIDREIARAQFQADRVQDEYLENVKRVGWLLEHDCITQAEADRRLAFLKGQYEAAIDAVAAKLIHKTEHIACYIIREGQKRGITVQKVYIEVVLAGRTYLVDPLRIVGN